MATAPLLVELACPVCAESHWKIDTNYRGMGGPFQPYSTRIYDCPCCSAHRTGFAVQQKSPPLTMLWDPLISDQVVDRWVGILRTHFPSKQLFVNLDERQRAKERHAVQVALSAEMAAQRRTPKTESAVRWFQRLWFRTRSSRNPSRAFSERS